MLIICVIFFIKINTDKKYHQYYKNKIENYQIKVDSLSDINSMYYDSISIIENKLILLSNDIKNIEKEIDSNKIQHDEKINIISTYTNRELQEFFTKRYNNSSIPSNYQVNN
jgi:hypothetical protein